MQSLGKQILYSILASVVLSALIFGLQQLMDTSGFIHTGIWSIVIFSAILGLLVAFMSGWGVKNMDAQSRPNLFIAITGIRMILSLIFVLIVVYNGLEDRTIWVINFFAIYLFYLVFEIYTIMSNLRAISNEGENNDKKH